MFLFYFFMETPPTVIVSLLLQVKRSCCLEEVNVSFNDNVCYGAILRFHHTKILLSCIYEVQLT